MMCQKISNSASHTLLSSLSQTCVQLGPHTLKAEEAMQAYWQSPWQARHRNGKPLCCWALQGHGTLLARV